MRGALRTLARLVRAPVLHFLVIGGLLYVVDAARQDRAVAVSARAPAEAIVFSARQVEQLRQDLTVQNGWPPSRADLQAAVEAAVDEEVLYRQALASGLDQGNASVHQRLVQIGRFVAEDPDQDDEALYRLALQLGLDRSDLVVHRQLAATMRLATESVPLAEEVPPDENELQAYLQEHGDAFIEPWRVRLSHIYFSEDFRGAAAEADARAALDEFRKHAITPETAIEFGDPFLLGDEFSWQTRNGLAQMLGESFARAVPDLPPGAWSEPIRSDYGWHLVWVEAVRPAELPALADIRDQVREKVLAERREGRLHQSLQEMRARYAIRIEAPWISKDDTPTAGEAGHG